MISVVRRLATATAGSLAAAAAAHAEPPATVPAPAPEVLSVGIEPTALVGDARATRAFGAYLRGAYRPWPGAHDIALTAHLGYLAHAQPLGGAASQGTLDIYEFPAFVGVRAWTGAAFVEVRLGASLIDRTDQSVNTGPGFVPHSVDVFYAQTISVGLRAEHVDVRLGVEWGPFDADVGETRVFLSFGFDVYAR